MIREFLLLAIRAERFLPKADSSFAAVGEKSLKRELVRREKRGSFKGAAGNPLRAPSFLFNDLVIRRIPRKSVQFHSLVSSSPTAPSKFLSQLSQFAAKSSPFWERLSMRWNCPLGQLRCTAAALC